MQQLIKDELRAKIDKDVAMLETILEKLNVGKGSQASRDTGTYRAAKKAKTSAGPVTTPTEKEVVQAAKALHAWLSEERTPFRSLLFILAGKGTYYAAHAAPKRFDRNVLTESFDRKFCPKVFFLDPQIEFGGGGGRA